MNKEQIYEDSFPCKAFRCNICGRVVPSIHRSKHLIVAHKFDGSNIKQYFTDIGKLFKRNPYAKGVEYLRKYHRNQNIPDSDSFYNSNTKKYRPFIKILYTPWGNKR